MEESKKQIQKKLDDHRSELKNAENNLKLKKDNVDRK